MTTPVEETSSTSIRRFALFVGTGLAMACAWHFWLRSDGVPFPRNTFLFLSADRFNDWHNSVGATIAGNPYFSRSRAIPTYFPFTYVVLTPFSKLPRVASTVAYLTISVSLLVWAIALCHERWSISPPWARRGKRFESPLLVIVCAVSYPIVFVLDEGNLDLWVCLTSAVVLCHRCWLAAQRHPGDPDVNERQLLVIACVLSYPVVYALDRGNLDIWIAALCLVHLATLGTRRQSIGLGCLAVAIAFKGYPAIFLTLALSQRNWRAVFACVAMAASLTLGPLLFMWDGFAFNLGGFLYNLQRFHHFYVVGPNSLFASSDPYNGLRVALLIATPTGGTILGHPAIDVNAWSASILRVYDIASLCFVLTCVYFALAVPADRWRRITAICLGAILFPNVANDYKLTLLLPGLLALFFEPRSNGRNQVAKAIFALLMIPKSYVVIDGRSMSNLLNPCLLIALSTCVMVDARGWRRSIRLLPFRLRWLAATLPHLRGSTSSPLRGKPAKFLARDHRSMWL